MNRWKKKKISTTPTLSNTFWGNERTEYLTHQDEVIAKTVILDEMKETTFPAIQKRDRRSFLGGFEFHGRSGYAKIRASWTVVCSEKIKLRGSRRRTAPEEEAGGGERAAASRTCNGGGGGGGYCHDFWLSKLFFALFDRLSHRHKKPSQSSFPLLLSLSVSKLRAVKN